MGLGAWVVAVAFVGVGAAIWFGRYRSWTDSHFHRAGHLAMPWAGLAFAVSAPMRVAYAATGLPWLLDATRWALSVPVCFGFVVALTERPRWALPPWYRRLVQERGRDG